jgi:vacuolar protein sorting-associated protein 51
LLESFYGKTAIAQDASLGGNSATIPRSSSARGSAKNKHESKEQTEDSVTHNSIKNAEHLIRTATTHDLLETEEKLSLQVRTLDSTMQTLVYENYSRFIDATDAIRSIGVNVSANESGLRQLTTAMNAVSERARVIDEAVGTLRDQVAEKIRIQRLLTRLDTLLNLPVTLQEQIAAGKYTTATRSYLQAASILAKHSEGFESLRSIETECHTILESLKADLQRKLLHWSGRAIGIGPTYSDDDEEYGESHEKIEEPKEESTQLHRAASDDAPKPPHSMAEVFECAGALFILHQNEGNASQGGNQEAEHLYAGAVAAAMRLLDRLLDSHLIQVQERKFSGLGMDNSHSQGLIVGGGMEAHQVDGSALIPRDVLTAILEGATLYVTCFKASSGTENNRDADAARSYCLMEFVSDAFESFIGHVRSVLLEESIQASQDVNTSDDGTDSTHEEISQALQLLVQNVQELASGLVDPSVAINADFAAKFVDQAIELAESVLRRRVDRKFYDLRLAVVRDCLVPFVNRAVGERNNAIRDGKPALPPIVQLSSSTLSDCLQMVDDTIRSIFADSSTASDDLFDLKDATQGSTFRFASWLANSFEVLAGGDLSDAKYVTEAPLVDQSDVGGNESRLDGLDIVTDAPIVTSDDFDDFSDAELLDLLLAARNDLMNDSGVVSSDFILAIADLCRVSEVSVPDSIEQSFSSHLGVGKKRSLRGIFPVDKPSSAMKTQTEDSEIRKFFRLAGSRVLVQFAMNAGTDTISILNKHLPDLTMKPDDADPTEPSEMAVGILSTAKTTALECANILGGPGRAGPIPPWDDRARNVGLSTTALLGSRKSGLQLDVERMFKETVTIYPHPSEILESSRNAVLFLFFKTAFRNLFEGARLFTFSAGGYRQLQVDLRFLQHMIPHYMSSEYSVNGANGCSALATLLNDVQEVLDNRCVDDACCRSEDLARQASEIVKRFMTSVDDSSIASQFIITDA